VLACRLLEIIPTKLRKNFSKVEMRETQKDRHTHKARKYQKPIYFPFKKEGKVNINIQHIVQECVE
jgi:hypothetical protein